MNTDPKSQPSKTYNPKVASLLLRLGLAAVFAYAAVSALRDPDLWISYVPNFTTSFVDASLSLHMISILQLIVAAWLLIGRYLKYAATLAILLLGGIVVFNPDALIITFRDLGLIAAAAALFFLDD